MRKFLSLLGICLLAVPPLAVAWDDPGHQLIAAEAYRQLSPQLKAQIFDLLKAHPNFARWRQTYHPNPVMDLPATVFLCASTWPDEIKNSGNPYDHPLWHFIDYPLRPPDFHFEPDSQPTNNVLFGIAQCESTLADPHANRELRAVYLSYLIHLIGDLHQPLHCESWYGDAYPDGDRGGNNFYVKPADMGVRLHGIWDDLLGTTDNRRQQWLEATNIQSNYPRPSLSELTVHTTPLSWSLESRQLALQYGYLNGRLRGSLHSDRAPALPDGYLTQAKAVAVRQAALAGYRLADDLQKSVKWTHDLPLLPANTNREDLDVTLKIGVDDAARFGDETLVVTGRVTRVTVNKSNVLLRFKQSPGATPFTAVIFNEHTSAFGDIQRLLNHDVELSGTITTYRDRPEMILSDPSQLKTDTN